MRIMVVGGGGREHALAWKLAQSPRADTVFVAPGNAGTALEPKVQNLPHAAGDIEALLNVAQDQSIDLTVIGPEDPLADGIVDQFERGGCRVLGPRQDAAQLESSKGFSKDFMQRHQIPTARYRRFTEQAQACAYLEKHPIPVVIKADGLAGGKGVIIAHSKEQAEQAIDKLLHGPGASIVIEEYLQGREASFICLVDGLDVIPLASSQDHKARDDGGLGPNTGGMGAYSPTPHITTEVHERIMSTIIRPTLAGLAHEGITYRGFLYAGLMIDAQDQPWVLEYNCRFGDPETQPILMRLKSDFLELCLAATAGQLSTQSVQWDSKSALGVVLAMHDYPASYPKGLPISGLDQAMQQPEIKVFHAGTAQLGDRIVTQGGRVLCVCACGETIDDARRQAYQAADEIRFDGQFCRRDIGVASAT